MPAAFRVQDVAPSPATLFDPIGEPALMGAILPVRPEIQLSVVSPVREDGGKDLVFVFSRSGPIDQPLRVDYRVGGSASPLTDYTGLPVAGARQQITFAAGAATASLWLTPIADTRIEEIGRAHV